MLDGSSSDGGSCWWGLGLRVFLLHTVSCPLLTASSVLSTLVSVPPGSPPLPYIFLFFIPQNLSPLHFPSESCKRGELLLGTDGLPAEPEGWMGGGEGMKREGVTCLPELCLKNGIHLNAAEGFKNDFN